MAKIARVGAVGTLARRAKKPPTPAVGPEARARVDLVRAGVAASQVRVVSWASEVKVASNLNSTCRVVAGPVAITGAVAVHRRASAGPEAAAAALRSFRRVETPKR